MFDSTSKFPTGVLFGSSFDFGNFDECVGVRVPVEGEVQGRYCLAKFHVVPPEMGVGGKERGYRGEVANASAWEKILVSTLVPFFVNSTTKKDSRLFRKIVAGIPATIFTFRTAFHRRVVTRIWSHRCRKLLSSSTT